MIKVSQKPLFTVPSALKLSVDQKQFRLMSFNVCLTEESDLWEQRKTHVASVIRFHRVDLAGLQEPSVLQAHQLMALLPDYGWYGVCWGTGENKGKGSLDPILYRKSRYELIDASYFFLSQSPDTCSMGWDARYPRGTTWVRLRDKQTGQHFYFFNTHFDYHGTDSREKSAALLIEKIKEIVGDFPFIVTGDFNIFPGMRGEITYNILTKDKLLQDAQKMAKYPHHGPTGSWSGFKEAGQPGIKPDYIFVSDSSVVLSHGILSDCFDGDFPSDHLPIVSDIYFNE